MAKKKKPKKKHRGFWIFFRIQLFFMALILGAVLYYYGAGYGEQVAGLKDEADSFVESSTEETFRRGETGLVYDVTGKLMNTYTGEKDAYYLDYRDLPKMLLKTMLCIEDRKFTRHHGVDYQAILRAVLAMLENGEVTQGGSTITQQLARTVFLNNDRTWQRKMEEIFIAINLEKKYTKSQILEFYLNNINFGNGYYGIQAAAKGYFNKGVKKLDLSQTAFLCGIPNNPTLYNPVTHKKNAVRRRNLILQMLYEQNLIGLQTYSDTKDEKIKLERPRSREKNDYIDTYVTYCATRALMSQQGFEFQYYFNNKKERKKYNKEYADLYNQCEKSLFTSGYRIYTSINQNMQARLQDAIDTGLGGFGELSQDGVYKLQGAGVTIDNITGYVSAVVGGRSQDYEGYPLNRAYQSYRQPGSSIKPLLVYTPMLERGYTPDSSVVDKPIEGGPANSDGTYEGNMTLRSAVAKSKNTVAWTLFEELTPETGLDYLKAMNFARLDREDIRLPSALGGLTNGVSPLEMAAGYATLANDGYYRAPTCIMSIEDAQGNVVYSSEPKEKETRDGSIEPDGDQIYKTNAARMMTDVLQTVLTSGTGRGLGLGDMPSAGKTGTTDDHKDGWFVGYTRYYTTSIWVGYDQPAPLPGLSGATFPGNIWHNYMLAVHENKTPASFIPYISQKEIVDEFAPAPAAPEEGRSQENETQPQENETQPREQARPEEEPQPEGNETQPEAEPRSQENEGQPGEEAQPQENEAQTGDQAQPQEEENINE